MFADQSHRDLDGLLYHDCSSPLDFRLVILADGYAPLESASARFGFEDYRLEGDGLNEADVAGSVYPELHDYCG